MARRTEQKSAIQEVMRSTDRPLTPQEVLGRAQATVPGLGIATVYRNLKSLVSDEWLKEVAMPGESAKRYELADQHHHHHFQCRACERVFDIHACPDDIDELVPPGFQVHDHELVMYGHCADCTGK